MKKGWKADLKDKIFNIIPIKDLEPHVKNSNCKCNPTVNIIDNGYKQIVHFAFDNRQLIEQSNENQN